MRSAYIIIMGLIVAVVSGCVAEKSAPSTPSPAPGWQAMVQLDKGTQSGLSRNPTVAGSPSGNAAAVWAEIAGNTTFNNSATSAPTVGLWVSRYDHILGWQAEENLVPLGGSVDVLLDSYCVALNSQGDIVVAWLSNNGTYARFFSQASGIWTDPTQIAPPLTAGWLSTSIAAGNTTKTVVVAADGSDQFHLVWQDSANNSDTVYRASNSADGKVWSSPIAGPTGIKGALSLSLVLIGQDGSIWYAWQDAAEQLSAWSASLAAQQPLVQAIFPLWALQGAIDPTGNLTLYLYTEPSTAQSKLDPMYVITYTLSTKSWKGQSTPSLAGYEMALATSPSGNSAFESWNSDSSGANESISVTPLNPAGSAIALDAGPALANSWFSKTASVNRPGLLSAAIDDKGTIMALWSRLEGSTLRLYADRITTAGQFKPIMLGDPQASGHAIAPMVVTGQSNQFFAVWAVTLQAAPQYSQAGAKGHVFANVY